MLAQPLRFLLAAGLIVALGGLCYLPYRLSSPPALALEDGLARTPPMGWNSWNYFGCAIDEQLIKATADAMVASGMREAGYRYVVLDDCWQVARDAGGTIVADPRRFPGGIAHLADYVHQRGLLLGLYTDAGSRTCQGRPGSLGYEAHDIATYAAWGVDYVKIDWCYSAGLDAPAQYARFREAVAAAGRPMVLSICTWGVHDPWDWGAEHGHLWRTTGDISDRWPVVLQIIRENAPRAYAAGPGRWNDPDMLEVGNGGMSQAEYRSHFGLWAMMAAPLIAGNDLTQMDEQTRAILVNHEVIAIDQDPLGIPALIVRDDGGPQVWSRPLGQAGARAVALFNPTDVPAEMSVAWPEIGLFPGSASVRDLWSRVDRGVFADRFTLTVAPHDTAMLKIVGAAPGAPPAAPFAPPAAVAPEGPPDPAPQPVEPAVRFLGEQPWTFAFSAFGPAERNSSNGGDQPADGQLISIGGTVYPRGLGVHAPADLRFELGGRCSVFAADVGLDDEVGDQGAAVFQVWTDGALIYDSGVLTGDMPSLPVYLELGAAQELRLVVLPGGASSDYAHASWADARVACP